ncbi:Diphthamide biosynthesis protein 3 [Plasmodiophora brassicae]|uniref:Diphthamide biosynthesis protein 3 n=1 Tax=Plasmodiophora brassicae TaxID=37360 RepID=A0A0G4IRF2_PLABS|nr:hypothetical protein PBRA_005886 [Plasmodiophora brassicae]SPQ98319.1 unnamed protein product [Plasmodiophora brassicae]
MATYYDEVDLDDMEFDESSGMYSYPCPCGDQFLLSLDDIIDGEDVARCPSCSLLLKVVYDPSEFADDAEDDHLALITTSELLAC